MRIVLLVLSALVTCACTPLRYVTQAAAGQEDLNRRGVAIDEIVQGKHLDRRTRELLAHVPHIKAFGERHGLAHTKSYSRYVWLDRRAAVWVVSACEPLAFEPKKWSFPIVGSITYTGWFARDEATAYANEIAAQGLDVDVRPSQAYSTLGWFDDPILSTMIEDGDGALGELAEVVLHETLHATFYVPGQSTLNESAASFFGQDLALVYLDAAAGPTSREKAAYVADRARGVGRGHAMKVAYEALSRLYASSAAREDKLAEKARITKALREELAMKRPVTNATLIQYKTYGSGREELQRLLTRCDGSYPRLLRALEGAREVAKTAKKHEDPAALLGPLLVRACPG